MCDVIVFRFLLMTDSKGILCIDIMLSQDNGDLSKLGNKSSKHSNTKQTALNSEFSFTY